MRKVNLAELIVNGRVTQGGQSFRTDKHGNRSAVFECECGNRKIIQCKKVKSGHTLSCGCLQKELTSLRKTTHGHASPGRQTPTYVTWGLMIQRCSEKAVGKARKNYHDRGIKVCDRWMKFENFLEDMGERPVGMSIERDDNDGNYCKENCRWVPLAEQARNTRRTVMVQVGGVLMCLSEAERKLGMRRNTLSDRLRLGWTPERAISTPVRGSN